MTRADGEDVAFTALGSLSPEHGAKTREQVLHEYKAYHQVCCLLSVSRGSCRVLCRHACGVCLRRRRGRGGSSSTSSSSSSARTGSRRGCCSSRAPTSTVFRARVCGPATALRSPSRSSSSNNTRARRVRSGPTTRRRRRSTAISKRWRGSLRGTTRSDPRAGRPPGSTTPWRSTTPCRCCGRDAGRSTCSRRARNSSRSVPSAGR